ncbi:unnamed protein product [Spirodela intermedia]|uniref:FAS1 domain-containing protein n=1 Tax=Spirodela intermedia TaxID=51605 RepID=A0A7I8IL32_SPIIN|nr:unnamed protein product [Spirodela intermedia]CAA6658455.1 unnamed protein product [Spirodela intermedia]
MGTRGAAALLLLIFSASALPSNYSSSSRSSSMLAALLDSPYTELAELVEKALLLPELEALVGKHNLTIFAPLNEVLHPELRRFLLQLGNLPCLRALLLSHLLPSASPPPPGPPAPAPSPSSPSTPPTASSSAAAAAASSSSTSPPSFSRRLPSPRWRHPRPRPPPRPPFRPASLQPPPLPAMPISSSTSAAAAALVVTPSPSPPGPAKGGGNRWSGRRRVRSFMDALVQYGGYGEMADVLVNLTAVAAEMGRLVAEGYVLTVLVPSDEAMGRVAAGERLSEAGAPEKMVYYHLIAEYQTEESMYTAVRRWGKVSYETLRVPYRVGGGAAYLVGPDIYTDGRISVQGIDAVLFPRRRRNGLRRRRRNPPSRQGEIRRLMEAACGVFAAVGWRWSFSACR